MTTISGDLLSLGDRVKYIAHQCNCVSFGAAGLAKQLFESKPTANVYNTRQVPSELGTIHVTHPDAGFPGVINMFAQYFPGSFSGGGRDSATIRLAAFKKCLDAIAEQIFSGALDGGPIAFPWHVGCGLAGGHWPEYEAAIQEFASRVSCKTSVYIVQRPEDVQ